MSKLASGVIARTTSYMIDPHRVTVKDGWNNRFDLGDIASLSSSILTELTRDSSTGGLINAIHVRRIKDNPAADFEVVMGHRRFAAISQLLHNNCAFPAGIPAVIVEKDADELALTVKLVTENMQKPLLPLEEAAGYKRLRDGGMKVAEICKAVGRSDVHVRETLDLLGAATEVQEAVKAGKIAGSVAKVISQVAKGNATAQADMAADAVKAKGKGADAKAAKKSLQAKVDAARAAKAAAKGKAPKMRALSDEQLSELGVQVAKMLAAVAKEAGMPIFTATVGEVRAYIKADEKLAAAATFGALQALLAAAGQKVDLEF